LKRGIASGYFTILFNLGCRAPGRIFNHRFEGRVR
jgi:hypothetical protein